MNDNELIAWEVVGNNDFQTYHICLREDLADYLRDWCDAIFINRQIDMFGKEAININRSHFSIYETEVLV